MAKETVFAWTAPGSTYPEYVNLTRDGALMVVTVRASPLINSEGYECGRLTTIRLPFDEFERALRTRLTEERSQTAAFQKRLDSVKQDWADAEQGMERSGAVDVATMDGEMVEVFDKALMRSVTVAGSVASVKEVEEEIRLHHEAADRAAAKTDGSTLAFEFWSITTATVAHADRATLLRLLAARTEAWRPISTAPKSGYIFLAAVGGMRIGEWWQGRWRDLCASECDQPRQDVLFTPTHWMPLPEPPPAEQQGT